MSKDEIIELYEDQPIRTAWNETEEEWYFSVVDVVGVLTDSKDPTAYWRKLKQRLREEGNETVTNCHGLRMTAPDGKKRLTDVATTEQLLRIIQSIPSKKAEPFKMWLAQVGRERIEETIDPELSIDRALETYQKKGYSDEWIHQRLLSIRVRNALTDEWQKSGVRKGVEYAILTDEMTKAWSGMNTRQYKNLKGLKKENLRDNMSDMELILNMLAESTSTEISKNENPSSFAESQAIAMRGGKAAKEARLAVEQQTGKSVITSQNAAQLNTVVTNLISGGKTMNTNNIKIRLERKEEYREVENLVRESFWNVYRPGCLEHYVLKCLRNDPDFVSELDFVMEKDGKLIGQNIFVRTNIKADDGRMIPIMTMGPICITNELKRQGYGKILLDYSLEKAKELGCGAVCFEGNILFYGKSGFTYASEFGIRYHGVPEGEDASFFLCKELIEGYLDGITGEYSTPKGYFACDENPKEFERYESEFPTKEKLKLPGQLF